MPIGEALAAAVALAIGGGMTIAAAWRAAGRLVGGDPLERALATVVLGLGGLCALLLALGLAGLLTRVVVTAALALVATGVLLRVAPTPTVGRLGDRRSDWLVALVIGSAVGGLALALGLQGFTSSNDTLQYHAVNAGTWLREGNLSSLPVAAPGYPTNAYPSDHTLTGLWMMLATGSDQLVYAINVAWGLLCVLAAATLARVLGGRAGLGALLGLGVLVAPVAFRSQTNALLSDLAAAGGIVAGAAATVRAASGDRSRGWAVVAGVGIGLAAGSKYTAFAPAAAVVLLPVLLRGRRGIPVAATVAATAAPLVLFWLLRNVAEFGNPLYPQALGPLEGFTSPLARFDTPIASQVLKGNWEVIARWLGLVRDLMGLASLLAIGATIVGVLALRQRNRVLAGVAGVAVLSTAGYLWTPFTGGGPDGTAFLIGSQLRYALPALLLAAPVVAAALGPRAGVVVAAPMLLFGLVKIAQNASGRPELDLDASVVLVGVAAATLALTVALRPELIGRARRAPELLFGLAVVLTVGAVTGILRFQDPQPPTVTERLLAGCRGGKVGVVGARNMRELMGRRFEIEVVAIDEAAPAGRRPIFEPSALDRRIGTVRPDLVVGYRGPTQAREWNGPRGWRTVARRGPARFYAPPAGCVRQRRTRPDADTPKASWRPTRLRRERTT